MKKNYYGDDDTDLGIEIEIEIEIEDGWHYADDDEVADLLADANVDIDADDLELAGMHVVKAY